MLRVYAGLTFYPHIFKAVPEIFQELLDWHLLAFRGLPAEFS
jgi:hypothetical protein